MLAHAKDLVYKVILSWDGGNIGSVLSPHEVSLMEAVELQKKDRAGLLLLCMVKKNQNYLVTGGPFSRGPLVRLESTP